MVRISTRVVSPTVSMEDNGLFDEDFQRSDQESLDQNNCSDSDIEEVLEVTSGQLNGNGNPCTAVSATQHRAARYIVTQGVSDKGLSESQTSGLFSTPGDQRPPM